jgi:hypothetical protein
MTTGMSTKQYNNSYDIQSRAYPYHRSTPESVSNMGKDVIIAKTNNIGDKCNRTNDDQRDTKSLGLP